MQQFEVLIVGMGPVGLAAANLLGQAGINVRLIEKNEELSPVPKALFIDDEFFRLLSALGLEAAISEHTVYPVDFDYYSPLGFRVGHVVGRITDHHYPNRAATYQPDFEKILFGNLARFPSVSAAFGEELVGFTQNDDHIEAVIRRSDGGDAVYKAKFILAADGARSVCRRILDIDYEQVVEYGDRHVVIDVDHDGDDSRIGLTQLGWRRNYMSLPMPGGRRRYEFSVSDADDADEILRDETLTELFKPYRKFSEMQVIRKVVYSFRARLAKQLSKGRVFLLGDSAHIMPVFGSQGMNSGARDANNICWKLAAVLRGHANEKILETYQYERHRHAAQSVRIAVANGKLQAVRWPPVAMLRDLILGCVNLVPSLRRYIREMRYIPRPVIASRLTHGEIGPRSLVGQLLPNPGVRHASGRETLLDGIIGLNFALVGVEPEATLPAGLDRLSDGLPMPCVIVRRADSQRPQSAATPDVAVTDQRFDKVFSLHAGRWLIVRPDRVVAAVSETAHVARDVAALVAELKRA